MAEEARLRDLREWQALFPSNDVSSLDAGRLQRVVTELAKRKIEGLRLYEPMPEQERFHASNARIRILRGSNRGGKTLPAAVEVARAVTGNDPHSKYPAIDGRFFIVGKDLGHIGEVMWRKLGHAGAFRMIRDEVTGRWRAFRPWERYDVAYKEKSKEAPPLIPPRYIRSRAWESKSEGIPSKIILHNGWEMVFYSSLGKPPQGADLDGWWFDEEIVDEAWFPEMRARLLDRGGRGIWSATPQAGTDILYDLHERAAKENNRANRRVEEFVILLADNKHMSEEEKRDLAADLNDEERRVRVGGEFAVTSYRVYPNFSMMIHGVKMDEIPSHWTRYAVVDPGHQICAVLFAAVPPPAEEDHVYLYDELYLRECDSLKFAEAMRQACVGQKFQAFLMDMHFAMHTEAGIGKNILEQYTEALTKVNVSSAATGHSFRLASDNVGAGVLAVRNWLSVRDDGTAKLRVVEGRLPNFDYEIRRYHNQRLNGMIVDKPNQRRNNHLMDCLRYLAMYDPKYVRMTEKSKRPTGAMACFLAMEKRAGRSSEYNSGVRLGPGKKYV
jgi:hypothetical protein